MYQIIFLHVASLFMLSMLSAFVGFGFARITDDGMIFSKYREFLEWLCYWKDAKYLHNVDAIKYKKSTFFYYLTKPLGLCIICNTVWIAIIICSIIWIIISNFTVVNYWVWILIFDCIISGTASAGLVTLIVNEFNYYRQE